MKSILQLLKKILPNKIEYNNIHFFSVVDGVHESYPIIRASDFKPKWFNASKKSYQLHSELANKNGIKLIHSYRCPGIFDILHTGFIVPCPIDIKIDTTDQIENFRWSIASPYVYGQHDEFSYLHPIVTANDAFGVAEHLPQKTGAMKTLIKIHTPWHVVAPPGVKFLCLPVPYADDDIFEHCPGILNPALATAIHFQLYCKITNGTGLIKAGQPLMHLVPMSDKIFNMTVNYATSKELQWVKKRAYFLGMSFNMNKNTFTNIYTNFFFGK